MVSKTTVAEVVAALNGARPTVVFVSMTWCVFCRQMTPIWDAARASPRFAHIRFLRFDADNVEHCFRRAPYNVIGFPTFLTNRQLRKYVGCLTTSEFDRVLVSQVTREEHAAIRRVRRYPDFLGDYLTDPMSHYPTHVIKRRKLKL